MNLIRSYKHNVYCETLNKLALSGQDDKRIIDGINTYAYGYYSPRGSHFKNLLHYLFFFVFFKFFIELIGIHELNSGP